MNNISKPTTSLGNSAKVSIGETWGTITTTWATETRTWQAVSQLFTNALGIVNLDYLMTEDDNYLVQEDDSYLITEQCSPIINVTRPT